MGPQLPIANVAFFSHIEGKIKFLCVISSEARAFLGRGQCQGWGTSVCACLGRVPCHSWGTSDVTPEVELGILTEEHFQHLYPWEGA